MTKGEETRQRVIALAAPLFNQRGYAGCSMSDIMEVTGLEKGGIYRCFGSKEELAAEAFKFSLAASRKLRTDDLEHIAGAAAKLRYIMDRFVSEPSPVTGGCPLLNTAVDADDGNPVLRGLVHRAFADWRERLAGIIREGVREGELLKTCQPDELADTLVATLEGALVLTRLDRNRRALLHARHSLDLLLAAHTRG